MSDHDLISELHRRRADRAMAMDAVIVERAGEKKSFPTREEAMRFIMREGDNN